MIKLNYKNIFSGGKSSTNDENTKKQKICSKLVEHYRHIENSVEKLDKVVHFLIYCFS